MSFLRFCESNFKWGLSPFCPRRNTHCANNRPVFAYIISRVGTITSTHLHFYSTGPTKPEINNS